MHKVALVGDIGSRRSGPRVEWFCFLFAQNIVWFIKDFIFITFPSYLLWEINEQVNKFLEKPFVPNLFLMSNLSQHFSCYSKKKYDLSLLECFLSTPIK